MDKSGLKGYRAYLGLYMLKLWFKKKDFRFGKVRIWFDAKQPCFELT